MDAVNGLLGKITGYIDKFFGYADDLEAGKSTTFLGKYGKWLIVALLLSVAGKFVKINLGKKR